MRKSIGPSIAVVVMLLTGCGKPPAATITRALASTNVVFQTYDGMVFPLAQSAVDRVKQIVKQFQDPSRVEIRKRILPAYSGSFRLGDVRFGWVDALLCLRDPKANRYYVVSDEALAPMSEALMNAWGPPPAREVSRQQWEEILAEMGHTGKAAEVSPARGNLPARSETGAASKPPGAD
ncbi:MAG: hypothetical protein H7A46_15065 [Verrucomicrobiales bacterium]|nr:hypothetical protein [Verrucomicrobiales bacterium]